MSANPAPSLHGLEIAIVGLAGRFPGAPDIDTFWQLLAEGREGIVRFDDTWLRAQGVAEAALADPGFVRAGAPIEGSDCFDAGLFGIGAREAELMDPQQRLFLECAFAALEHAGHDPAQTPGAIGVFGGAGMNGYLLNLYADPATRSAATPYEIFLGNDKDFLATRVAYRLGLRGPAVAVQTACSSSLVAVHLACQSLLAGECELALAGGVALSRQLGYHAPPGGIHAPDGHCRAFGAEAAGTVPGNGVGLVVLRRLEDALAAGDTVHAVIKGSAINNDGAAKQSFTAPSPERQRAVIEAALAAAGVDAASIGLVEAHGTGTLLGDPVEVAALAHAFGTTVPRAACVLGSVKSNIGHLDAAAGIAGLIKAVLALGRRQIPPTLHAWPPNPALQLQRSPFRLADALQPWPAGASPRRAGVSSFGIGGTNAHVVLEEAPAVAAAAEDGRPRLLRLSARDAASLEQAAQVLAQRLEQQAPPLAAVAATLARGRRAFGLRRSVVAHGSAEAAAALRLPAAPLQAAEDPSLLWLFPGQGTQRTGLGRRLYASEPAYRAAVDACGAPPPGLLDERPVDDTALAQPLLFVHGWALAALWRARGLAPRALAGHSLGEWVAATVAGVFDPATALQLVQARGRRMQAMPRGAMLAVAAGAAEAEAFCSEQVVLAALNGPQACVLAGPMEALAAVQAALQARGIGCQPLRSSHAFHSPSMDAAARAFADDAAALFARSAPCAPAIPFASGVSGRWITAEEAADPGYWARQLRQPVRFADALGTLLALPDPVALEVGAGRSLASLLRQQAPAVPVACSMPDPECTDAPAQALLQAAGTLWSAGVPLPSEDGPRLPLPGTPWQRRRYWIGGGNATPQASAAPAADAAPLPLDDWFHAPGWVREPLPLATASARPRCWLLLGEHQGLAARLAGKLEAAGDAAFMLQPAAQFAQADFRAFTLDPLQPAHWQALQVAMAERGLVPNALVDLRALAQPEDPLPPALALLQALAAHDAPLQCVLLTRGACELETGELPDAAQAALHGLALVPGQEHAQLGVRVLDLPGGTLPAAFADTLLAELRCATGAVLVAWRGRHRWRFEPAPLALPAPERARPLLRRGGRYLVLGDLRLGLGAMWARALAAAGVSRLVLLSAALPAAEVPAELIEACAAAGTEVTALQAAADDAPALRAALEEAGSIDGVFLSLPTTHAGLAAPLALLNDAHWQHNLGSRLAPLQVLADWAATARPGFCCVQSSMSSLLGGLGLGAYAACSQAVDAFVARQQALAADSARATRWLALQWDPVATEARTAGPGLGTGLQAHTLSAGEAWAATERALAAGVGGVLAVSRRPLAPRRAQWLRPVPAEAGAPAETGLMPQRGTHPRPALATPYVAPRSDTERSIAALWQTLLRLEPVGVHDSFFDLGGHSLLAIQAIGRLREAFAVTLELRELLDGTPTVAGIAAHIDAHRAAPAEQMAALLAEVSRMSEADVQAQLAREN